MPEKIRILFLSAEPVDKDRLRLGQEIRDIEQKLRVAPRGRSFQLISQWAVRPHDLMETLFAMNLSLHRDYQYSPGSTNFSTSAFDVYASRRGVCQDLANLFICMARLPRTICSAR